MVLIAVETFYPTAAACFHSYIFFLYFRTGINIVVTQHYNIIWINCYLILFDIVFLFCNYVISASLFNSLKNFYNLLLLFSSQHLCGSASREHSVFLYSCILVTLLWGAMITMGFILFYPSTRIYILLTLLKSYLMVYDERSNRSNLKEVWNISYRLLHGIIAKRLVPIGWLIRAADHMHWRLLYY